MRLKGSEVGLRLGESLFLLLLIADSHKDQRHDDSEDEGDQWNKNDTKGLVLDNNILRLKLVRQAYSECIRVRTVERDIEVFHEGLSENPVVNLA